MNCVKSNMFSRWNKAIDKISKCEKKRLAIFEYLTNTWLGGYQTENNSKNHKNRSDGIVSHQPDTSESKKLNRKLQEVTKNYNNVDKKLINSIQNAKKY